MGAFRRPSTRLATVSGRRIVSTSAGAWGIRWYQLDATTNAVLQQGNLSDPNFDYHQPSIAASPDGSVLIGFTRSGTAAGTVGFAGAYAFAGTTSGGVTTFGSIIQLKNGEVRYTADGAGEQRRVITRNTN